MFVRFKLNTVVFKESGAARKAVSCKPDVPPEVLCDTGNDILDIYVWQINALKTDILRAYPGSM
jgi:hypothetical protein